MVEKRGRHASADLEVVPLMPGEAKPQPPAELGEKEAEIWKSIVDSMPLRYFGRETWGLLISLCRHRVAADIAWERYIKALTAKKKGDNIEALSRLHARESANVRRLSADLRLSKSVRGPQPVVTENSKRNQVMKRPWETYA